jgi:hypothetical protein
LADPEVSVAEVEDGVGDELAGAVIRDVAAAVYFDDVDAALREGVARLKQVGLVGVSAEGEYGGVFDQEEGFRRLACFDRVAAGALRVPNLGVRSRSRRAK